MVPGMPYFIRGPGMVHDARPLGVRACAARCSGFRRGLLAALPVRAHSGIAAFVAGYSGGPAPESHRLPSRQGLRPQSRTMWGENQPRAGVSFTRAHCLG